MNLQNDIIADNDSAVAVHACILASKDGRPFFSYSQDSIATNSDLIKKGLTAELQSGDTEFYYSLKTNPNLAVVEVLTELGWGLDVSSARELEFATGLVGPGRTQFSGCAKEGYALAKSLESRIRRHHIDSLDEWNVLRRLGTNLCLRISVEALRDLSLRFGIETEEKDLLSDAFALKHGLSVGELDQILSGENERPLLGLHFYLGREQYSSQRLSTVAKVLAAVCQSKPSRFVSDWSLSIGPGLPVADSKVLPTKRQAKPADLSLPHVSFEIGRALVGPSGIYAAQVLAVKTWDSGKKTVIINGGLQHLGGSIRPVFSDQPDEVRPRAFRSKENSVEALSGQTMQVNIFGSLCLGHDVVLAKVHVPADLKRGDWLVFSNTGAYGLSAGVPRFITQDLPREFLSQDEKIRDVTHKHFQLGIWS